MYNIFIGIILFFLVLFVYIHVYFHIKTSDELEIYELDEVPTKEYLEEICDMRQPVIFRPENDLQEIIENMNLNNIQQKYGIYDIHLRDITEKNDIQLIPLNINDLSKFFQNDKEKKYYSEGNKDFLIDSGLSAMIKRNDDIFRPYMMADACYDLLLGNKGGNTQLRYNVNYRNFYFITSGKVRVKLAPPYNKKYMRTIYNYGDFEFYSSVDNQSNDYKKIQFLEMNLTCGEVIHIPANWWYSFHFEEDSSISCFYYRTYMNIIAILPYIMMYILQKSNTRFRLNIERTDLSIPKQMSDITSPVK
jgi:hypothetical protein